MLSFLRRAKRMFLHSTPVQATFRAKGCLPWTLGYEEYKWSTIAKVLNEGNFDATIGTERYGYRIDERVVEYPWLFSRLPACGGLLLDAGSALNHEMLVNHPIMREKKVFISTLAPEGVAYWQLGISYVYEDLRNTCFREEFFDWVCCISTIEHVGMNNTMLYTKDASKAEKATKDYLVFLNACKKCLKPGGTLFMSFPYGGYKDHGWFQVFDAAMIDGLVQCFHPSRYEEAIFQYKDDRWCRSSRDAAKDATCFDIHFQKNYDSDYAAFSRGIACLELVK